MLVLLVGIAYAGWTFRVHLPAAADYASGLIAHFRDKPVLVIEQAPKPDRDRYDVMREDLKSWRIKLAAAHRNARSAKAKEAAENDARVVLEAVLPELMRCWLGTPWDFHGTAEGPGGDPIACGYFVSTVLKDAGFKLDRYKLAQQPSSRILTTFVSRNECSLMVDVPYQEFSDDLVAMEPGVYLVGLDTHVAFLVVGNGTFRFIHSSSADPHCVVDEFAEDASVLRKSRWRMLANLTGDSGTLRKWLSGKTFAVSGT